MSTSSRRNPSELRAVKTIDKSQCRLYEEKKQQIKQIKQEKQVKQEKQKEIYREQNKEFSKMGKQEWEKNIKEMFQDLFFFDKVEKEFQMVYDNHATFSMKNNELCEEYFEFETWPLLQSRKFESYINVKERLRKKITLYDYGQFLIYCMIMAKENNDAKTYKFEKFDMICNIRTLLGRNEENGLTGDYEMKRGFLGLKQEGEIYQRIIDNYNIFFNDLINDVMSIEEFKSDTYKCNNLYTGYKVSNTHVQMFIDNLLLKNPHYSKFKQYLEKSECTNNYNTNQSQGGSKKKQKVPKKYIPQHLTEKDKRKQTQMLKKSREMYKKKEYIDRKPVKSFKSKVSPHVKKAREIYSVKNVSPNKELAKASGCSVKALKEIVKKGQGA